MDDYDTWMITHIDCLEDYDTHIDCLDQKLRAIHGGYHEALQSQILLQQVPYAFLPATDFG